MAVQTIHSLEKAFTNAYSSHYGQPPSQIQTLKDGRLLINGIAFQDTEVMRMIRTLELEQEKRRRKSLVKRLIGFFSGN